MNKRIIITIFTLFVISFSIYYFLINSNITLEKISTPQVIENTKKENIDLYSHRFSWNDLGIIPQKNLEGNHYVFTAFDFDQINSELVIAGNYEENKILFIKDTLITELEIKDTPIDILINKELIYVLCLNKFIIIKSKKILKEFNHNIKNVTAFDKLLFFDDYLTILMSDGSTYRYLGNNFANSQSLLTKNKKEIWIQKTSSKSFEIKSKPTDETLNKKAFYTNEIGSITFLGQDITKYYVILDIFNNTKPLSVARVLKCSNDNFEKTIIELPVRKFSFIKNDIKIHKNKIYIATLTENHLAIKSIAL